MKRFYIFLLAVLLLMGVFSFIQCGIYAEANVIAYSPIYAQPMDGKIMAWGYARNVGTATAENCRMILEVFIGDRLIESHQKYFGPILPGEKMKFEIVLDSVKFGDDIGYKTKFDWD